MGALTAPAPINMAHELGDFDCGEASLNDWLRKRALNNEGKASRTYVVCVGRAVVGYYCLSAGGVGHDETPKSLSRNMPNPIPILLLGRLAIDKRHQGRGLGNALLADAIKRALSVADAAGVRALMVHALSEEAKRFYATRYFIESPMHPRTLFLELDTARQALPK